jgi:hypothetical protein
LSKLCWYFHHWALAKRAEGTLEILLDQLELRKVRKRRRIPSPVANDAAGNYPRPALSGFYTAGRTFVGVIRLHGRYSKIVVSLKDRDIGV